MSKQRTALDTFFARRLHLYRLLQQSPREALNLIAQETGRSYPLTKKGRKQAMSDLKLTKEKAALCATFYERDAQELRDRYGTGVRPSWVSADLAIADAQARKYRELEAELDE